MRIAVLTDEFPPGSRGGSGVVAYREAKAMAKLGHEVRVYVPREDASGSRMEFKIFATQAGFKKHGAWKSLYDQTFLNFIKPEIEKFSPDIVHCHHVTNRIGLKAVDWCANRWRTVMTVHDANLVIPNKVYVKEDGSYGPNFWETIFQYRCEFNPFLRYFAGRTLSKMHKVIFVSDAIRGYYEGVLGKRENFITLHNALELDEWPPEPYVAKECVSLGFASRPTGSKGWGVFVQTLKAMRDLGVNAVGSVIGDEQRVGDAITKLKEDEKRLIGYYGSLKDDGDLWRWYAGLDAVFVGSIYLDPYPNVTIESLAVGRGVIVGPYTGSREIIDEKTGYSMQPHELTDVSKMAHFLSDPGVYGEWARGASLVRNGISMDGHMKALFEIYQK